VAEDVAQVDPDLAIRNDNGQIESVRYSAINAMLLNEFLKQHRKVEEQARQIHQQTATIGELKKTMDTVIARVKEQDSQIQKASVQIGIARPMTKIAVNQP